MAELAAILGSSEKFDITGCKSKLLNLTEPDCFLSKTSIPLATG